MGHNKSLGMCKKLSEPSEKKNVFYLDNISNFLFNHKSPVHRGAEFPSGDKEKDNLQHTDPY